MGSKQPSNVTTTTTNIPEWLKPHQQEIWNQGMSAINGWSPQSQEAPIPAVSPLNQAQLTGDAMLLGRGLGGSPLQDAAQGFAFQGLRGGLGNPFATMSNSYMGNNPMLQNVANNITNQQASAYEKGTRASRDARYAMSHGYNSSAHQQERERDEANLSDSIGKTMTNLYYGDYNRSGDLMENQLNRATQGYQSDMQNNMQMLGMVPQLSGLDYRDAQMVRDVGDRQYAHTQNLADEFINNYLRSTNGEIERSDMLQNLFRGMLGSGGSSTTSQGRQSNWMSSAGLGLGALGALFG